MALRTFLTRPALRSGSRLHQSQLLVSMRQTRWFSAGLLSDAAADAKKLARKKYYEKHKVSFFLNAFPTLHISPAL